MDFEALSELLGKEIDKKFTMFREEYLSKIDSLELGGKNFDTHARAPVEVVEPPVDNFSELVRSKNNIRPANFVAIPEKFSSLKDNYSVLNFKLGVTRIFDSRDYADRFSSDEDKINFIGHLLDGPVREWWDQYVNASSSIQGSSDVLSDLNLFWELLDDNFGVKHMPFENEVEFIHFEQGSMGIKEFNLKFQRYAILSGFNPKALICLYISKLNDTYLTYVKTPPMPEDVEGMMRKAAFFDPSFLSSTRKRTVSQSLFFKPRSNVSPALPTSTGQRFCDFCKRSGHTRESCYKLKKPDSIPPFTKFSEKGKDGATRH